MVLFGTSLSYELIQLRQAIAAPGGRLAQALRRDIAALQMGVLPTSRWELSISIVGPLKRVLRNPQAAAAEIERIRRRSRVEIAHYLRALGLVTAFELEFVLESEFTACQHRLLYAAETSLAERQVVFGRNYPGQLADLCDALDATREDLERELRDEIDNYRINKKVKFRCHMKGLLHVVARECGVDRESRREMLTRATIAKQEAMERWSRPEGAIPAVLLAEHLFRVMRHAALSAWEDRFIRRAGRGDWDQYPSAK